MVDLIDLTGVQRVQVTLPQLGAATVTAPASTVAAVVPVAGSEGPQGPPGLAGDTQLDDLPDLTTLFENALV